MVEKPDCKHSYNGKHYFVTFREEALLQRYLAGVKPVKVMYEEVVHDDNPNLDDSWVCDCPLKKEYKC